MNIFDIIETLIGSFFGALFAFLSGIAVSDFNERRKQKHKLKRYFELLDNNQDSIDAMGRLFDEGISQNNLKNQIITVRDSHDSKHKLHEIKKQGVELTLEIYENCKKQELQEKILRQIDFQDKVAKILYGLYELSDDELDVKIRNSSQTIFLLISDMKNNKDSWSSIKAELKKLHLFPQKK